MSTPMRLARYLGLLMMLVGFVCAVLVLTGVASDWLRENWTCATGRGIPRERDCGWLEAHWSALVLSGALVLGGFIVSLIPAIRGAEQRQAAATVDLSALRRRRGG